MLFAKCVTGFVLDVWMFFTATTEWKSQEENPSNFADGHDHSTRIMWHCGDDEPTAPKSLDQKQE